MGSVNRRNFMKYAGTTAAAGMLAGCAGSNSGTENSSSSGSETESSSSSTGEGERPVEWMATAWGGREGQVAKFEEMTGIDLNTTTATIPTIQQRILGGERESVDAYTVESSGAGALAQANDATLPVPTDALDNWNEDQISDAFTAPGDRLSHLGEQTETINDLLWADEEQTELLFPPHVYNFDAIGYNPKFVDDVSLWSALFDEQYEGKVSIGETASITIPETLMHLVDNDMTDGDVGDLNNPSKDQLDAAIDFLIEQKKAGQFRATWTAYGASVTQMASEEAILGDIWQPAAMDIRRQGTPCTYATMDASDIQGYRYWYGGIGVTNPGAEKRGNVAEIQQLINDVHYGAWFPGFIQGWGYSVPHYENKELVRDGSDESGDGMGPEYYDWAYEGKATYDAVDEPALFDPQQYDWSDEEGTPNQNGSIRDSGTIEERFDNSGFFMIWPDNADHMLERWRDFQAA